MTGKQNRLIDQNEVNAIRNRTSWRLPSPEAPKSSYDAPPPVTEPGYLIYLKQSEDIGPDALIRSQLNSQGLGHPMLILHKEQSGILHCLAMTSFNNRKCLSPHAKERKADFRFITNVGDNQSPELHSADAGQTLLVNHQLDKKCWINQSRILKVEVQSTKKYANGMHCLEAESLQTIKQYCSVRLNSSLYTTSDAVPTNKNHRRCNSAPTTQGEKRNLLALDSWRPKSR